MGVVVGVGVGGGGYFFGQAVFGQVVVFYGSLFVVDGKVAGEVHVLEGGSGELGAAPVPVYFLGEVKV